MFSEQLLIDHIDKSDEAKRLLASLKKEVALCMKDPNSGIGLVLNAIRSQASNPSSQMHKELGLSFQERQAFTMMASAFFKSFSS